jgi:hypothetical protein
MIKSLFASAALLALLASCSGTTPNDAGYFDNLTPDPAAFERSRQEELLRRAEAADAVDPTAAVIMADIDPAVDAQPATLAATVATDNSAISQTQDFTTIKQRETIESDSEKLAALAESYEVIAPTALPTRKEGANIAAYAINQTNQLGNRIYIRDGRAESNCFAFANDPDEAQRVFLENGGPKRDARNLDTDGDGFACKWNPESYRKLVQ